MSEHLTWASCCEIRWPPDTDHPWCASKPTWDAAQSEGEPLQDSETKKSARSHRTDPATDRRPWWARTKKVRCASPPSSSRTLPIDPRCLLPLKSWRSSSPNPVLCPRMWRERCLRCARWRMRRRWLATGCRCGERCTARPGSTSPGPGLLAACGGILQELNTNTINKGIGK